MEPTGGRRCSYNSLLRGRPENPCSLSFAAPAQQPMRGGGGGGACSSVSQTTAAPQLSRVCLSNPSPCPAPLAKPIFVQPQPAKPSQANTSRTPRGAATHRLRARCSPPPRPWPPPSPPLSGLARSRLTHAFPFSPPWTEGHQLSCPSAPLPSQWESGGGGLLANPPAQLQEEGAGGRRSVSSSLPAACFIKASLHLPLRRLARAA